MGGQESTMKLRDDHVLKSFDDIRPASDSLSGTSSPRFASTDHLYPAASAPELRANPIRPKELLRNLRKYHREKVRLPASDTQWAKQLVYSQTQKLLEFCKRETGVVRNMEYAGPMYERLETRKSNEFEVMVVLKTCDEDVTVEQVVPKLYSKLKLVTAEADTKLVRFTDTHDYLRPDKLQNWLDKLAQAWTESSKRTSDGARVRTHKNGTAVEMIIRDTNRGGSVTAQLVPCVKVEDDSGAMHYFLPCAFQECTKFELGSNADRSILWRRTFSLREREIMSSLDRSGSTCRAECLKILKFLFSSDRKLRVFPFYLLKTAFFHYRNLSAEWRSDQLSERFLEMLRYIQECVKRKDLPHYFVPSVNLLKGLNGSSLNSIETRLQQVLTDEKQLFYAIYV
ncbi:cyclic GMP-AMP synthase-like [Oculina patagonica]